MHDKLSLSHKFHSYDSSCINPTLSHFHLSITSSTDTHSIFIYKYIHTKIQSLWCSMSGMARIRIANKVCKHSYQRSIDVGGGLRFPEICTVILISIILPRPADHCADQRVRVRARWIEVWRAFFARHPLRMVLDRGQRRCSVMDPLRVPVTVPDHIRHFQWIVS